MVTVTALGVVPNNKSVSGLGNTSLTNYIRDHKPGSSVGALFGMVSSRDSNSKVVNVTNV